MNRHGSLGIRLASFLWMGVNRMVRAGYARGFFPRRRIPTYVVGVGNLQAGGAGKTPLVAHIAHQAHAKGKSVCILTRGYGGSWEKSGGIIKPEMKKTSPAEPSETGDEAALLQELCPFAWIGVGSQRVNQLEKIVQKQKGVYPDVVILDDAFQHWKIIQDVRIVALTCLEPNQVLFREGLSALQDADLIVWTKGDSLPLLSERYIQSCKPLTKIAYDLSKPADSVTAYVLVTGVAHGESVLELAESVGYRIEKHFLFADHMKYDRELILSILSQAEELACRVALTGKDWIKWKSLGVKPSQVQVLELSLRFEAGENHWDATLWGEKSCG